MPLHERPQARRRSSSRRSPCPGTLPATTTFAFSGDVGAFNLGNGESAAFTVAPDKSYVVTETVTDGFTLTSVVCSDAGQAQGASTSQGPTATINVENGEEVTCTFTNTQTATPVTPPGRRRDGGRRAQPRHHSRRRQRRARRPAAPHASSGTNGCAAKYAIVDVRGRQIARVSFRLNGTAIKTLKQPNVAGMFRLRVLTKSLPHGPARVTADVVFKTASATPRKRLAFQFSRCPGRTTTPRPVFTGDLRRDLLGAQRTQEPAGMCRWIAVSSPSGCCGSSSRSRPANHTPWR